MISSIFLRGDIFQPYNFDLPVSRGSSLRQLCHFLLKVLLSKNFWNDTRVKLIVMCQFSKNNTFQKRIVGFA
jgi:hypothetical protein